MFIAAMLALSEIDRALGLPEDGCNSTARTLAEIKSLKRSAELGVKLAHTVMADQTGSDK
ncbi:MAG: hypothetical protein JWR21_934 [Herminiimonas sp.]|nr:hypothetical protein [Herminiimonas sp.]